MMLIQYLRWLALWGIDYQSDDWRDDLEVAWSSFLRWREGEFHENWKRAVVLAKREAAWEALPPLPEEWQAVVNAIGDMAAKFMEAVESMIAPIQAFADAMKNITFPTVALSTHIGQRAQEQDAALDALAWYHDLPKAEVARMVQKEAASGLWAFEEAVERVRIRLAKDIKC